MLRSLYGFVYSVLAIWHYCICIDKYKHQKPLTIELFSWHSSFHISCRYSAFVTMACLGTGGKRETTEWEDILKEKGVIPEKTEEELAEEALLEVVEETVERFDPHENKDIDELDEDLEDADSDEERILEEYKQRRLMQMKAEALMPRFGPGVAYVSAADWKREVTEASDSIHVVVHLVCIE